MSGGGQSDRAHPAKQDRAGVPAGLSQQAVSGKAAHPLRCDCDRCWLENTDPDPRFDDLDIEICTNCGAYYTPHKGQDYYDTRCGRCG